MCLCGYSIDTIRGGSSSPPWIVARFYSHSIVRPVLVRADYSSAAAAGDGGGRNRAVCGCGLRMWLRMRLMKCILCRYWIYIAKIYWESKTIVFRV